MTAGPDQARAGLARSGGPSEKNMSPTARLFSTCADTSARYVDSGEASFCARWLGIAVAVVASLTAQPTYESDMTFFVASSADRSNTPLQADEFAQRRINSYVGVINSERLAEAIVRDSGRAAAYGRDHQDDLGVRRSGDGALACHCHRHLGRPILDRGSVDCRKPRQAHRRTRQPRGPERGPVARDLRPNAEP